MLSLRRTVFVVFLVLATLVGGTGRASAQYPDPDSWVLQVSSRLVNGFGFSRGLPHTGLLGDTGIRTDFLFGKPGDEHFRIGPAVDFRSACTLPIFITCVHNQTIEGGLGGTLLIPFRHGYPITITPAIGYAFRRDAFGGNGMYLSNTFAWGYRPYNYFHRYGYGIEAYVNHRVHLDNPSAWEMTFGIEFDFELAVWIPILMVRMATQHDDPDQNATPLELDVGGSTTGSGAPSGGTTTTGSGAPSGGTTQPTGTGGGSTAPAPAPAPAP